MDTAEKTMITIEADVNAPVEKVWNYWTSPEHIVRWNNASDDWHTPRAENDLVAGGKFSSRMESKDGTMGFDFEGHYTEVEKHKLIAYTLGDGRTVSIQFEDRGGKTFIRETFEAENTHPADFQKKGWQAILDNFKKYSEEN